MTDTHLTLFCVVDGETTSFPVAIESTKTVGDLKKLIKAEKAKAFEEVDADQLTLWRVSFPVVPKSERKAVSLADISTKEELDETDDISDVFEEKPPKKTIHIIVQRPLPGDLHADIKKITGKFFAPGLIANFLDAFVKGEGALPITSGSIHGLPRAWRRGFGKPPETRPSLLFMDLPDPSTPNSHQRTLRLAPFSSL
ncbi:hypothetical protein BGX34_012028 [Mortierella sp. NVP85]|nr:hypothetical protein BGX34_012028 [Mortierella sp. NVP85]